MKNISLITDYIKKNTSDKTLDIVKDKRGRKLIKVDDEYWRCYKCIECGKTFEKLENNKAYYEVGKVIGKFQKNLKDFPINKLEYTIKDFHNTRKRFNKLMELEKTSDLSKECIKEISFIKMRENLVDKITNNKEIPIRVTHNDTKLNNIMIDKNQKGICLIDLDTVMPGYLLYDYGDAIRVAISKADEDEKDLRKVKIDREIFKNLTSGFIDEVKDFLLESEKELLVDSCKIITLECGIRFLTDYLENNIYFKTDYEKHNLVRARNQFKLLKEIEKNEDNLIKIVKNVFFENEKQEELTNFEIKKI